MSSMNLLDAGILGLVEGITEYLPISSTGHLIITGALLKLDTPEMKSALNNFEIVIQGGAILAVIGLYRTRVLSMLQGLIGKNPAGLRLFINLVIAFLPSAILGLLFHDWIDAHLFSTGPVLGALAWGGAYMIIVERFIRPRNVPSASLSVTQVSTTQPIAPGVALQETAQTVRLSESLSAAPDPIAAVSPLQALFIGCLQCVALWPGTSRSMMTITGGYFIGLPAAAAAEFSFLLGLPTLSAACAYGLLKDFKNAHDTGSPTMFATLGTLNCLVGIAVAAISAALAVKWLVGFLNRKGLTPFGIYRILLAIILGLLIYTNVVDLSSPTSLSPPAASTAPSLTPPDSSDR